MKSVRRAMRALIRKVPAPMRRTLQERLPDFAVSSIRSLAGVRSGTAEFQEKHRGIEPRWALISPHLPVEPSWMLDVGSNLGDTAARAAALGHYVIGVETRKDLVCRATDAAPPRVAFMVGEVSREYFEAMPRFSTVFLFSVLHRIWAYQGRESAAACVVACAGKTDTILVEGAIRHERYLDRGHPAPEFESNDLEGAVAWHLRWFESLLGGTGWQARHLGSVPSTPSEPHRPVFLLTSPRPPAG